MNPISYNMNSSQYLVVSMLSLIVFAVYLHDVKALFREGNHRHLWLAGGIVLAWLSTMVDTALWTALRLFYPHTAMSAEAIAIMVNFGSKGGLILAAICHIRAAALYTDQYPWATAPRIFAGAFALYWGTFAVVHSFNLGL